MTIQFPQIDWTTLIPNLVGLFFGAIGNWILNTVKAGFNDIFSPLIPLVQTPLGKTWELGPIQASINDISSGATAVLTFALVLLGLRCILSGILPYQIDAATEFLNGIFGAIVLTLAFPILVVKVITLFNQAAGAIAMGTLSSYFTTGGFVTDPFIQGVLYLFLLFFIFRLVTKAVWRIGFLAVLLPVGFIACLLFAIPQLRWILGWWTRVWGGMLIAQLPSTLALTIGLTLATAAGGSLAGFIYALAFVQLATDLYDLIPFGMVRSQGSPFGAVLTAAALARTVGGFGAGAAISAGQAAAQTRAFNAYQAQNATQKFYGYD